jgi:hypothetical protein
MSEPNHSALPVRAGRVAETLLRGLLPQRWRHTQGVAERAAELAVTVPAADRPLLIAAAWLHDIGYAPTIGETGFPPLDGALYLSDRGWDERLVALVAHHCGARFVPVEREVASLMAEFDVEDSVVSDALTYADQTIDPDGRRVTVRHRIAEAIPWHGSSPPHAQARVDRVPYLLAVADRVEKRLVEPTRPAG